MSNLRLISTGRQENRMTDLHDSNLQVCRTCGSHIWYAQSQLAYVDTRSLSGDRDADRCPGGALVHQPE